jgi:hypothetical protein
MLQPFYLMFECFEFEDNRLLQHLELKKSCSRQERNGEHISYWMDDWLDGGDLS